jgi:hypothetical protein
MPLSLDRPGVFKGRMFERWVWHVIDPAYSTYAGEVQAEWERRHESTNLTGRRRVLLWVAWPASILVAQVVCRQYLGIELWPSIALSLAFGIAVSFVASRFIYGQTKVQDYEELQMASVVPIDRHIVAWANDETTWPALWKLSLELVRLHDIEDELRRVAWQIDTEHHSSADVKRLRKELNDQLEAARDAQLEQFDETAKWAGFSFPRQQENRAGGPADEA